MSDFIPKPSGSRIGGLSPKAQKPQALREKAAAQKSNDGAKAGHSASSSSIKTKDNFANSKKTGFQRKSV